MGADIVQIFDGAGEFLHLLVDEVQHFVHVVGTSLIQGLGECHFPALGFGVKGEFEWVSHKHDRANTETWLNLIYLCL